MNLVHVPEPSFGIVKCCPRCNIEKPLDAYYKRYEPGRSGHESICKICKNDASKLRQKLNPERHREIVANWRRNNKAQDLANQSAWGRRNRDKIRIKASNRRAKKAASGGKLSRDIASKLFALQKGRCACCREPLGQDFHIDHIMPIALGGSNSDDNVQLLHGSCNLKKSAKHPVDFMQQIGFLL